ncbi:MAG: hypothetical protein R3E79_55405 [Caldilineaceae bacterium]
MITTAPTGAQPGRVAHVSSQQLVMHGRMQESDYAALEQEYHSIREVREMLIEALEKEKQQIWQQGIEQGIYRTLTEILKHRLGAIPTAVEDRLQACTLAQLNTLVNPALDATTWDEFAAHLPQPTA